MTYEAWRITYQSSEQAARAAYAECTRLQAKVAEMEQQEPVAWYPKRYGFVYMSRQPSQFERGSILYLRNGAPAWRIEGSSKVALLDMSSLPHGTVFYALPCAQTEPNVPREAIEKMLTQLMDIAVSNGANSISIPDEYVEVAAWLRGIPAQSASSVPDGWKLVPIEPTAVADDDGGWTKHTEYHWSRFVAGERLDYWPSRKKFQWRGKVLRGDVMKIVRAAPEAKP